MEAFLKEFDHLKIQLEEIKSATNNFNKTKVIGAGGFGPVYGGELSCLKERGVVAIKRLDQRGGQGVHEFWDELTILSRKAHENLISLLGFCSEGGEMILVYEYASNGSLDRHLGSTIFTWKQRLKACLDAARGLSYLHDPKGTKERIIHRDIKSANILIDAKWNAKVADMGLSKIAPANQKHTGLFTRHAGTPGYCDPSYFETYFLTKESDVYSFGVLLLEVLCGRLCCERRNGQLVVHVSTWIRSYEQNQLKEIIFNDLKQQLDQSSLKTYSDIAYKCLQKSREERPTMAHVVKELETALRYQEIYEIPMLPEDYNYKQMLLTAEDPLNDSSEIELKMLLLKGILINKGKTWFSRDMNGHHCEMISITACVNSTASGQLNYVRSPQYISRFAVGCYEPFGADIKTLVRTQFLSPQITYTVNLVFKRRKSKERYIGLEYKLEGDRKKYFAFVLDEREDGWLTAELYQFTSDQKPVELEILFFTRYCSDILVEGIEFRPLNKEVLRGGENVDMQPKKDLCDERLIKHFGEERFCFAKDGKKCLMMPAIAILEENKWEWMSLPETRFEQVAADCGTNVFCIFCKFSSEMLSPQTKYATYLVYKPPDYKDTNRPLQVVDENSGSEEEYNIFLRTPQTPVINWNEKVEKTFNTSSRPKIKGLPKPWSDGWMEVQIHEFQTCAEVKMISTHLRFSRKNKTLKGIIVQGLEFRPV